jgi:hypothetical protein
MKRIHLFLVLIPLVIVSFWGCKSGLGISEEELENLTKPIVDRNNPQGLIYNDMGFRLAVYGNFQGNDEYTLYINKCKIGVERPNYWRYRIAWHIPKNIIKGIIDSAGTSDIQLEIRVTSIINYDISDYFDEYREYISDMKKLAIKREQTNFTTPVRLFYEWSQSHKPILQIDSKGNLYLTWIESLGDIPQAMFCFSQDGGLSWSQVLNISRSSNNVDTVDMDIDEEGHFYMVWKEYNADGGKVYFSRSLDSGFTWYNPRKISQDNEDSHFPVIEVDANGKIYIFWYSWLPDQSSEPDKIRFMMSSDRGDHWEEIVFLTNESLTGSPVVNSGDDGTIYFLCHDYDGLSLYFSEDAGLNWLLRINDLDIGWIFGTYPSLVINQDNNFFLIWDTYDYLGHMDNQWIHFLRGMDKGTNWSEKQVLNDVCDTAGGKAAMCVNGDHINVVMDCFVSLMLVQSDDLGQTWSYAESIPGTDYSVEPAMVMDKNGKFYLVYVHRQDDAISTRALKLITW